MANTDRIRKQLKDLESRKSVLLIERQTAADAHFKARQAVISSNMTVASLEPFQMKINTFDSLISDIESLIETKKTELERDVITERRSTLIREAKTLAERAKTAGIKCAAAIPEFSTTGIIAVDKFLANRKIIWECRTRFKQIVLSLIPSASAAQLRNMPDVDNQLTELFAELDSLADFSVLRANAVFSNHEDKMIDLQINSFGLPQSETPDTWRTAIRERESLLNEQERLRQVKAMENPPTKKTPLKVIASLLNSTNIF